MLSKINLSKLVFNYKVVTFFNHTLFGFLHIARVLKAHPSFGQAALYIAAAVDEEDEARESTRNLRSMKHWPNMCFN